MSNEVTIEQKNEAIALFMSYEKYEDRNGIWFTREGLIKCLHHKLQDLQYHTSWDWLMPVVEKISKMPLLNVDNTTCTDPRDVCYPITFAMPSIDGKKVMFRFKGFGLCIANTIIEAAHEACYEVSKYFNQQKQSNEQRTNT